MIRDKLVEVVARALMDEKSSGGIQFESMPDIGMDTPKNPAFGDFTTNVALALAGEVGKAPRDVAAALAARLAKADPSIERVEVAGPGFINFYLKPDWLYNTLRRIFEEGDRYGFADTAGGARVQVEFVSANPNGPITVAHGRGGAVGDTIASLLTRVGYDVTRESYINDAPNSTQMQNFGRSVHARYMQALGFDYPMPEDGYQGEYVVEIGKGMAEEHGDSFLSIPEDERIVKFTQLAEEQMLKLQKSELERFGVKFDVWFSEATLHAAGKVQNAIDTLKERGFAYEKSGATWLKSTSFGDDKDRALVRSNGQPTYIAADAAYHFGKFERGFEKVVDCWGPDHHGYIARTKAAVAALGCDPDKLDIIIYQAVRLLSGGEVVMMSKRAGDVVLLSELIDEVGKDAARFFFLMRSVDSTLDFDLELAKSQSSENPVYYVQYAHARICSMLRVAQENGVVAPDVDSVDLSLLSHDAEVALIKKLGEYPELIAEAATLYEPHRVTRYAQDLAYAFHSFYTECRVMGEDESLRDARLTLVRAAQIVLANALTTLGISAPERM